MKRLANGVKAQKQNKLAKHWESRQEWIDNFPLNPTCHHEDAFDACKMEPIYNQEPAYACDGKIVDWKTQVRRRAGNLKDASTNMRIDANLPRGEMMKALFEEESRPLRAPNFRLEDMNPPDDPAEVRKTEEVGQMWQRMDRRNFIEAFFENLAQHTKELEQMC